MRPMVNSMPSDHGPRDCCYKPHMRACAGRQKFSCPLYKKYAIILYWPMSAEKDDIVQIQFCEKWLTVKHFQDSFASRGVYMVFGNCSCATCCLFHTRPSFLPSSGTFLCTPMLISLWMHWQNIDSIVLCENFSWVLDAKQNGMNMELQVGLGEGVSPAAATDLIARLEFSGAQLSLWSSLWSTRGVTRVGVCFVIWIQSCRKLSRRLVKAVSSMWSLWKAIPQLVFCVLSSLSCLYQYSQFKLQDLTFLLEG